MASTTSRVWLITGCSTGFGRSLAQSVLNHGERLVATARDVSTLRDLADLVKENGEKRLLQLRLDVTKADEVKEAFKKAIEHFGRIDVVVNNAGYGLAGEFESLSDELGQSQLDVNFWGVVKVSREALRVFREVNQPSGGRLIQISSGAGFVGIPGFAYYSASKFALEGLTESVAKELKPEWNIKITIVQPGAFHTNIHRSIVASDPHPAYGDHARTLLQAMNNPAIVSSLGDVSRAAEAIYKVSEVDDPPLRLPLGPDAVNLIKTKISALEQEVDQWIALAQSTSDDQKQAVDRLQQLGLKA